MSAKSPSIPPRLSLGLNRVKITFERSETFSQLEGGLKKYFLYFYYVLSKWVGMILLIAVSVEVIEGLYWLIAREV